MNVRGVKFQPPSVNTQMQMANDWISAKNQGPLSFDAVLKRNTNDPVAKSKNTYKRSAQVKKEPSLVKNGSLLGQSKRAVRERSEEHGIDLKKHLKSEIAQNKLLKEKDANRVNLAKTKENSNLEETKESTLSLEDQTKEQAKTHSDEVEVHGLVLGPLSQAIDPMTVGLLESIQAVDFKAEDVEKLALSIELIDDQGDLSKVKSFLLGLEAVISQENLKNGVEGLLTRIDTKLQDQSEKIDINTAMVPKDKANAKGAIQSEADFTMKAVKHEVEVVSVKESSQADTKGNEGKEHVKQDFKLESKLEKPAAKAVDEHVNVMKDQNTNISSAKVEHQPKQVLAKSITNQIVQGAKMSVNLSDVGSEILIKLNPKNLGNLALKMSFEKGVIVAQINVENQVVKGLIESNLEDLKNALKNEGYVIGELDVSVNKDNSDHKQSGFEQHANKGNDSDSFEEIEEKVNNLKSKLVNDERVDYFA